MSKPNYSCTQGQLYTIGRAAWQNCNARLAAFTAFKAKYVALFITGKINAITAAENLPDNTQRVQVAALLRKQLEEKAEECRDTWQRLKLYILDAFPENEMDSRLSAAGANYYGRAGQDNWESVKRLMINGDQFIEDNTAALTANNNMPATWGDDFATMRGEFEVLYNSFVNASLDTEVKTQDKIEANNDVYTDLISMLKDGQRIYRKDEAAKKIFTFDQLLNDVAGAGQGGLKGTVTDAAMHQPIEGVLVKIIELDRETTTDADGKYEFTQLAADTYTVEFSKAGFQTLTLTVEIETGVTNILDVEMVAV